MDIISASSALDDGSRLQAALDITTAIRAQLPEDLGDRITIDVRSDPFHLRTRVRFIIEAFDGERAIECDLDVVRVGKRIVAAKVPDTILARLCIEIKSV